MQKKPEQTIWIARHATRIDFVDPNWKTTAERAFDPHLAEQGVQEAQRLAQRLADEAIEFVYASPFLRAVQTATPIAAAAGVPLRIEPGVCEWMYPDWFTCVPELIPDVDVGWQCERLDTSYRSPAVVCYPETWEQMAERAGKTARRLAATGANLVLVGHGATVIGSISGLLERYAEHTAPAPPASLFKLVRFGEQWELELEGDVSHLNGHAG